METNDECALLCASNFFCSAFIFDSTNKTCELSEMRLSDNKGTVINSGTVSWHDMSD